MCHVRLKWLTNRKKWILFYEDDENEGTLQKSFNCGFASGLV
jgi:hypothetical protein